MVSEAADDVTDVIEPGVHDCQHAESLFVRLLVSYFLTQVGVVGCT